MRSIGWISGLVLALATPAHADKQIADAIRFYTKERTVCETRRDGLQLVIDGATTLQAELAGSDLESVKQDIAALQVAMTVQLEYCGELASVLEWLGASARGPYRAISIEHSQRDAKIRQLRGTTSKLAVQLDPVSKRLIPRFRKAGGGAKLDINSMQHGEPLRVKYPNGRALDLPPTNGTWKLSHMGTDTDTATYTDTIHEARLYAKEHATGTCANERERLAGKIEPVALVEAELPEAAELGAEWSATYKQGASRYTVTCVPRAAGGFFFASAELREPAPKKKTKQADKKRRLTAADFPRVLVLMIKSRQAGAPGQGVPDRP